MTDSDAAKRALKLTVDPENGYHTPKEDQLVVHLDETTVDGDGDIQLDWSWENNMKPRSSDIVIPADHLNRALKLFEGIMEGESPWVERSSDLACAEYAIAVLFNGACAVGCKVFSNEDANELIAWAAKNWGAKNAKEHEANAEIGGHEARILKEDGDEEAYFSLNHDGAITRLEFDDFVRFRNIALQKSAKAVRPLLGL